MTDDFRKIELLMTLRNHGVRDQAILEAIERTPREDFLDASFRAQAYADHALPIACGQTISQPFVVAYMTDKLKLDRGKKVLEIGTGSGYQTAILARLAKRVYTIERYRTLAQEAGKRFKELGIENITQMVGDGYKGWPKQAPFDRIIVTAAAKDIPPALAAQLGLDGIMIIPLEEGPQKQDLYRITHTDEGYVREKLLPVRFVPLVAGVARES